MEHHPGSRTDLRLIGNEVQIRLYAEHLEVYYKDTFVDRMERVRGEREARVDYRSSAPWCASPGPLPGTGSGSRCFPP